MCADTVPTRTAPVYTKNFAFHYAFTPDSGWALYDVKTDPACEHDLAAAQPETVTRLPALVAERLAHRTESRNPMKLILTLCIVIAATGVLAQDIVTVGAGSYLTARPKPCKPLPEISYKTDDLKGPMLTGQWWSSLVWQKYSQNLFAHPLTMQCASNGLTVNYPGARITGGAGGIFGSGGRDFVIGHSAVETFPQADCGGFSDWFVTAAFATGPASLRASFGHGSPFVFCTYAGGNPTVSFAKPPQIWSKGAVLGITVNGHHYGLFGATGSTWSGLDGTKFTNNGKSYFAVALLPDNQPQTLALFTKYAYNHVTDTRVEFTVAGGVLKAEYKFTVKAFEGTETRTIFALYPHQWKYTTTKLTELTYGSVRGAMKVGVGQNFVTEVPIQGVLPMFPAQGIRDRERMLGYLKAEAAKKPGGFGDTYWEGKLLGRLATLSGIAEVTGAPELQKIFVDEIKRRLENWFTAAPGKEQPVFYYNATWGTLVGSRPSYGSDFPLNDHHFHYGYFIRAAAEVARLDPAWAEKWSPMVNLLIRDIASPDRGDKMFPYIRCFDKYAGHSWASGDANFADGNNQESSSESMNAWYGMILWGAVTGDARVRDTGLFLFNTERTAVEEYWFDVSGTNYPKDFPNVALGMVWGGKGAFATWFSGDIDCIHGINWLPFTPASIYMGRFPDYVKKNFDRIVAKRKTGADFNTGWGDLVCMFGALADPAAAAAYIDAHPNCKLEGGNSHAFMCHWIHTLNNLGRNDATVQADSPLVNVFNKSGKKTYAAYNYQAAPLTVTFTDGAKLQAAPRTLTVK
jgi:endoglucanase Acf2